MRLRLKSFFYVVFFIRCAFHYTKSYHNQSKIN